MDWIVLGMAAALLHVWNHALFKSLLFFSAGSVIHAVHTREIDHLGGLAKWMPATAFSFLIGAVAICGLPPLNGFVSELLLYLGLFHTLGEPGSQNGWVGAAFGAPALALIGALALACFVKVFATVFLGTERAPRAVHPQERGPLLLGPMFVLVACCVGIGLAPGLVAPALDCGIAAWSRLSPGTLPAVAAAAPLGWISLAGGLLLSLTAAAGALLHWRVLRGGSRAAVTWDCGYAAPSPRMQYTASSFAQMLVGLFRWALRPRVHAPGRLPLFPRGGGYSSEVPETVLDLGVLPAFRAGAALCTRFRFLQRGGVQMYLLYIFAILVVLLLWQ
jgi:hydrogenase-4 component B